MKNHRPARIIALLMALVLTFAACAGPQAPTDAPTAAPTSGQTETQAPEPTASSAPEQTDAPTQTEPASQEPSQTEEAGLPELAALTATLGEATASFTAPDDAFDGTVIEAFYHPGGLIPTLEPVDAEELTEEGAATIDRAMRAYTSTGTEDLIIQAADSFWLYDHLTEHQQTIYDAIYVLAMDPVTPDYYVSFQTTVNPGTDQMMIDFLLAWLCIGDDHPELWWAYYWNGTTSLNLQYNTTPQNGRYTCYLSFTEPYTTFEEDVTAFNAAVEEFLSDIDPDADEAAKALQVHDKLIEWGIYDMDILQNNKLDFGHTAFGPFVGNSSGAPHYCVCDGYAHAYQYALQQLGMEALVVCGMAGDAGADGGQGGHAWSMVDIDGRWYEVDACWDDHTDTLDEVKAAYAPSSAEYRYYTEMLTDESFMDRVNHFMYRLMTAEINNYTAPDNLTYTTKETHDVIRANLHRSALYGGQIVGIGPRYCPSIEDKVVRFADKERHQTFLEPEGLDTDEVYVQGMSSSLPADVQEAFYKTIIGLEDVKIVRPAYAIEYDCIESDSLQLSLEHRQVENLFCAGQFNGSSGYEEAAAQGLIAGINAARKIQGKDPLILDRSEAYIGVLIDDLVTKGTSEPYRIMTSRAEYRLLLRQDNADLRLTEKGYEGGLVSEERYQRYLNKKKMVEEELERLENTTVGPKEAEDFLLRMGCTPLKHRASLKDLLKRPQITYKSLLEIDPDRPLDPGTGEPLAGGHIAEQVEVQIKYAGYIEKQLQQVERFRKLEDKKLPADLDYEAIDGLRIEAKQKLSTIRPLSIGQASRINGVSPADINVLMIWMEKKRREHRE